MIFLGRLGLVLFVALVSLRCLANGHGEEPSVTPPVKPEKMSIEKADQKMDQKGKSKR